MNMNIYLDNAATTRVRPEVVAVMTNAMNTHYGNPSSPHDLGLAAEEAVRRARNHLAIALGVKRDEIVFTSGGTEANNLAIIGAVRAYCRPGDNIVLSAIEHPSVTAAVKHCEKYGVKGRLVPVLPSGVVDTDTLGAHIDKRTRLLTIAHVNNEIGTIQSIAALVETARTLNPDILVHVDAVQSFGRMPVKPAHWDVDLLSVSGHKIHGPKGIGALYARSGVRLVPLLVGGGQEKGLRSGTENVPGIVGFGEAARLAMAGADDVRPWSTLFYELLQARMPQISVVGPSIGHGAPHILNVSVPHIKGEVAVRMLSDLGVYVSTGSACSTKQHALSHVLLGIGLTPKQIDTSLRVSFSYETTDEHIETAVSHLVRVQRDLASWHK